MSKTISFIIPAYNAEKFLDKCIPSFINKEVLDEVDVIVVNDGSTDNTKAVAQKYCDLYPNSVRLINQENKGHGGALNTGCATAKGKYLKVIDADDWIETHNLPAFIELLKNCESDVVLTHYYTINISTGEVKKWKSYPKEHGKEYTFDEIMETWKSFDRSLNFHGITYKTEFYHKYCIQLSEHVFYEDQEYATIPCCYAKSITPFDLFIYNYRIGDVQQSVSDENKLKRVSHTEKVLKRLISEYQGLQLEKTAAGRRYYCMKVKGLFLGYTRTVMLLEKNKKVGRKLGDHMMLQIKTSLPMTFDMAIKQYKVFRLMNVLRINKKTWERILRSKSYNTLRKNHDFK